MERGRAQLATICVPRSVPNIRDFALALREGRPPAVTGEGCRKVTRVLNLIYETAGVGPFAKR